MAIEKKENLFYELMIRGNHDPQAGELGSIMTYMLQTGTALVDSDNNTLVAPYAPNPARDLTKAEAIKFLGDTFGDFVDHLTAARGQVDAANTVVAARDREVAELKKSVDGLTKERDAHRARIDAAKDALFASTDAPAVGAAATPPAATG